MHKIAMTDTQIVGLVIQGFRSGKMEQTINLLEEWYAHLVKRDTDQAAKTAEGG